MIKKLFLSPLFALFFTGIMGILFWIIFNHISYDEVYFLTADWGIVDTLTIGLWVFTFYLLAFFWIKGYIKVSNITICFMLILLMCAVVREMGIQHCLTTSDTTPFKLNFFKKPTNPFGEKIIFGSILLSLFGIIFYLIGHFFKKLWIGFFHFETAVWTFVTFFLLLIVSKILDRLPSKLVKNHIPMSDTAHSAFSWFEETSEILLPLLLIILLGQIFVIEKQTKK